MRIVTLDGRPILSDDLLVALATDGAVLVRESTTVSLSELLFRFGEPYLHPHESAPGITLISPKPQENDLSNYKGFTSESLIVHTDRSMADKPPTILGTVLTSQSGNGGDALLLDGADVVRLLIASGFRLPDLSAARIQNHMQGRPIFTFGERICQIRYRDDDVAHPVADSPQLISRLKEILTESPLMQSMSPGDGYVVHNHRYLHGRTGFSGDREVCRVLVNVKDHAYSWLNHGYQL